MMLCLCLYFSLRVPKAKSMLSGKKLHANEHDNDDDDDDDGLSSSDVDNFHFIIFC